MTIKCGIIGDPVDHSIAPQLFSTLSELTGIDLVYFRLRVEQQKGMLKETIMKLKAENFAGFNVTAPYKIEVMKFLDIIDPKAKVIGAVNTVVNKNGLLIGYNTDAYGAIKSIENEGRKVLTNDKVVILGAGGCARAISNEIYIRTKKLVILNDNVEMAKSLTNELISNYGYGAKYYLLKDHDLKRELINANFVLHTTPVGMHPNTSKSIIKQNVFDYITNIECLNKKIYWDSIYKPKETCFLKFARMHGARTINGLGMLTYQIAKLFKLYTGKNISKKKVETAMKFQI